MRGAPRSRDARSAGVLHAARAAALFGALAVLAGCGDGRGSAEPEDGATPAETSTRPDVLGAKLAHYGVHAGNDPSATPELRPDTGLLPGDAAGDSPQPAASAGSAASADLPPALIEEREGLVELLLGGPRMLPIVLGDVEAAGAPMSRAIAAALVDPSRPAEELRALVDLSRGRADAVLARALLTVATAAPDAELRGYAASALQRQFEAEGADAILPGLISRQKYERDGSVLRWIDETVDLLRARIADGAAPSDALVGECWRAISDMSGAHFQLRGVDDARFVLARLGRWAAGELALALSDRDPFVRLHSAQVLERMGAEGAAAAPALTEALRDENLGVAGAAAEALAVVAGADAEAALLERLDGDPPHELRVALTRALGSLEGGGPTERLAELFRSSPASDLRLATARGLLAAGEDALVLPWLADELEARVGDPAGAETLLGQWLQNVPEHVDVLEAWVALGPAGAVVHTGEEARARRRARALLVRGLVKDA